jgi:MtN3 and saliva related transmembrane protein
MAKIEILGIIAGCLSSLTFIPQVVQTWKTKTAKDISLSTFVIAATSCLLWLIYGLVVNLFSVIFTNAIVLSLTLTMIYFKLKYK